MQALSVSYVMLHCCVHVPSTFFLPSYRQLAHVAKLLDTGCSTAEHAHRTKVYKVYLPVSLLLLPTYGMHASVLFVALQLKCKFCTYHITESGCITQRIVLYLSIPGVYVCMSATPCFQLASGTELDAWYLPHSMLRHATSLNTSSKSDASSPPYMQACPGVQWAIPTTASEALIINARAAANLGNAVALYLFNPSYLLSSYANNEERVQSASLRIKSATGTSWITIRDLAAIENTLGYMSVDAASGGSRKLSVLDAADLINAKEGIYYLQVGSGAHGSTCLFIRQAYVGSCQ